MCLFFGVFHAVWVVYYFVVLIKKKRAFLVYSKFYRDLAARGRISYLAVDI